jgi:hypothetical protein
MLNPDWKNFPTRSSILLSFLLTIFSISKELIFREFGKSGSSSILIGY